MLKWALILLLLVAPGMLMADAWPDEGSVSSGGGATDPQSYATLYMRNNGETSTSYNSSGFLPISNTAWDDDLGSDDCFSEVADGTLQWDCPSGAIVEFTASGVFYPDTVPVSQVGQVRHGLNRLQCGLAEVHPLIYERKPRAHAHRGFHVVVQLKP